MNLCFPESTDGHRLLCQNNCSFVSLKKEKEDINEASFIDEEQ
jgi:hypothetical protein